METRIFRQNISIHPNPSMLVTYPVQLTISSQLSPEISFFVDRQNYPSEWPRPSPVMVLTNIIHIKYMIDNYSNSLIGGVDCHGCLWSEINSFKRGTESILDDLSPLFASLDIALPYHREIANGISQEFTNSPHKIDSDEECILIMAIVACTVTLVDDYSEGVFERMIEESRDEYERRMNYGMVPAATESLAVIRKDVKVEEKSRCTICLDDLDEFESAMPCEHMFHDKCIVTWLKQSHYCPICRFELPTHVCSD